MTAKREITRADIMEMEHYATIRKERRAEITAKKRNRRMDVGPHATFYFESYETMWHQVHEMLYIEKGGEDQIEDELLAYNPLIPKGNELVATVMFEIPDETQRRRMLSRLGGVEQAMSIRFDGETVTGDPEADVDRTTAEGKASSVQFIHFRFTPEQVEKFRKTDQQIIVAIEHENYGHMAVMPERVRAELARDFD